MRDAATLLISPDLCRACSLPLLQADAYPVCADCLASLVPPPVSLCWTCGDALGLDEDRGAGFVQPESLRCAACALEEPRYARAVAFGSYRGTLRHLIHLYKFDGVRPLAVPLGKRLAQGMAVLLGGYQGAVTVVAVPLFQGKRSFNQSELLAEEAVRCLHRSHLKLPLTCEHRLLRRTRWTESQSHLTPNQRKDNVRNAFAAAAGVRDRHILLVDDVLTTGATADACAAELLRAGAASVHVATLARAHRRDTVPAGPSTLSGGDWASWTAGPVKAVEIQRNEEGESR